MAAWRCRRPIAYTSRSNGGFCWLEMHNERRARTIEQDGLRFRGSGEERPQRKRKGPMSGPNHQILKIGHSHN